MIPEQEALQESRIQGLLSSLLVLMTLSSPPQPESRGKSKDDKTWCINGGYLLLSEKFMLLFHVQGESESSTQRDVINLPGELINIL